MLDAAAAVFGKERAELGDDLGAERILGHRESEGDVRVEAFQLKRVRRTTDAEIERGATVRARPTFRQLSS